MRATRSSLKVNLLDIPKTCNNGYTAKAFAVAGPRLWNNILDDEWRRGKNIELYPHVHLYVLLFLSILLCFLCHCTL